MEISVAEDMPSASKKQKHGLACVLCAAAKTKCQRVDKSSSCERCIQFNKQCTSQTPIARKRKAGPPTTTRVAQLEQKLDGLVTLLTSQQVAATQEDESTTEQPSFRLAGASKKLLTLDDSASGTNANYVSPSSEGRRPQSRSATDPCQEEVTQMSLTITRSETSSLLVEDGRVLLDVFYMKMLPYFPFAVLQPDDTAESLQREKPFLWNAIRYIASTRDLKRQEALGAEIMNEVSSKLILSAPHNTKSLELLQGLLLFAAYNHYQFTVNAQMSTLLYLAKTITALLGIDRAPGAIDRRSLWLNGNPLRCHTHASSDRRIHTLTEQRAFLACYYLVMSRVKLSGSNADIFPYTPYIEKCCQSLEATQECQSDLLLVYLVRLQRIVQEINQTFPYDEIETFRALGTPVALCIKVLRTKLSALRSSLPLELERNPMFLMTYHSAELSLYEVALYDSPEVGPQNLAFHLQLDKLGLLHGCLASLNAYFDVYTHLPKEDVVAFPFTIWMQSGLAILTGIELSFLQLDGWDTAQVRESINVIKVLDREIQILEETASKCRLHPNDDTKKDIFWRFAARMHKTRELYDSQLTVELKKDTWADGVADHNIDLTATMDGILAGNGWDDSFWQTFVSDQWDTMDVLGNGMN